MNCILSVSADWGIGKDNGLLFRLAPDMAFFKQKTMGNTVIMGHNTLKSLPGGKPLPGRVNLVLSRSLASAPDGVILCRGLADISRQTAGKNPDSLFVIGGEAVYRLLLPYCRTAYITKVEKVVPADRFFPNLDENPDWALTGVSEPQSAGGLTFTFCTYTNQNFLVL